MTMHDPTPLNAGDIVRAKAKHIAVFGIFCTYREHEILMPIPEVSWIPCFASCAQVAAVDDEMDIKILHHDKERNKIAGSIRAIHPESDPWTGHWKLRVGDVYEATVVRWVEKADRCGDQGGYLLALRTAALVMLCGHGAGEFASGDKCAVVITLVDDHRRKVIVELNQ
jgi:ribosomal protein S1